MKRFLWLGTFTVAAALLTGCGNKGTAPVGGAAGMTGSGGVASNGKTFYWVQTPRGLAVHRLTQVAFTESAKKLGYNVEVIGTDTPDLSGTIALAEQALAKGDAAGFGIWAGSPAFNPLIAHIAAQHIPVILPHFPVPEGSIPGATGCVSTDPALYAVNAADVMGKAMNGKGTVAITQGDFDSTENTVTTSFTQEMHAKFPQVNVLAAQKEGFDAPSAIATAVAIMQAHPDLVAALSTTGGGATTWAGAQQQTGKKIMAVGMDYTRENLDHVKKGDIYGVVAQPVWEESYQAAILLDEAAKGKKIPWWTKLPAPLVTKDDEAPYYALLDKAEASVKNTS